MKLSAAISPLSDICYATQTAFWPTIKALWQSPALLCSPAKISQLFMTYVWTNFASGIDENSGVIKRSLITANAHGAVLDLGAGFGHTAKYLDHDKVSTYIALEPNALMHSEIRKSANAAGFMEQDGTLLILGCGAQDTQAILELTANLGQLHPIDTIVSFLTLCTIPNPEQTMTALVRDVLAAGGTLVFYEHVLSHRHDVAWWQRFWTPIWKIFFDGCRLDRPTHLWIERMGGWKEEAVWGKEGESEENIFFHRIGKFVKGRRSPTSA